MTLLKSNITVSTDAVNAVKSQVTSNLYQNMSTKENCDLYHLE